MLTNVTLNANVGIFLPFICNNAKSSVFEILGYWPLSDTQKLSTMIWPIWNEMQPWQTYYRSEVAPCGTSQYNLWSPRQQTNIGLVG